MAVNPDVTASTIETLIQFVTEKAAKARQAAKTRREMADSWRSGSEQDHRDAHQMAERQMGRKMPYQPKAEREKSAAIDDRIAVKDDAEAEKYETILALLTDMVGSHPLEKEEEMVTVTQQGPRMPEPFVDTPVLRAKRTAFDDTTQANLDALIVAVRAEASAEVRSQPSIIATTDEPTVDPSLRHIFTIRADGPCSVCDRLQKDPIHGT